MSLRKLVPVTLGAAAAIALLAPFPNAAALSLESGSQTISLPQRTRSGNVDSMQQPASALLKVVGEQLLIEVTVPDAGAVPAGSPPLRLAVLLWNRDDPTVSPPSVLFVRAEAGAAWSLAGQVYLDASSGGPRLVRDSGTWQKLGAKASVSWNNSETRIEVAVPLAVVADLCPDGALVDGRVQNRGALYSYGAAASWFQPPEPSRAVILNSFARSSPDSPVQEFAASLRPLPINPGPQAWAYARRPLPLEQGDCLACEEATEFQGAEGGGAVSAIEKLQHIVETSAPSEYAWQQAMLGLQSALLESGQVENSIETGLSLLEADGPWEGTAVPALRTLTLALNKAGIRLGEGDQGVALKSRFLNAVSDRNFRAAYGADLLVLQSALPEARALLETVVENESASAAVIAHALFQLQKTGISSGQGANAVALAERIEATVPLNLRLRQESLDLFGASPPAEVIGLRERLTADRREVCQQYFAAATASSPGAYCPESPEER